MALTLQQLEAEARQLTAAERADLAQRLFASVEDGELADGEGQVEQAWIDESNRRYERYVVGETQSVPAPDALARVRARLGI